MPSVVFPRRHRIVLVALLLAAGTAAAQDDDAAARASRQLAAGQVLETMAVTTSPDVQYGWVLTRGGTFIEAGREKIFRTRLTQAGNYLLHGEVRTEEGTKRLEMFIEILARSGQVIPEADGAPGIEIVTTNPPLQNNALPRATEHPVLTLTPSAHFGGEIGVDIDTDSDVDGNGNTEDDPDVAETLFAVEHNSLHLWFASSDAVGAMRVWTIADDGTPLEQRIAAAEGAAPQTSFIDVEGEQDGSRTFRMPLDPGIAPEEVLYTWDFGDGTRSFEDSPTHRYFQNGEYDIRVHAREMATGRIVAEATDTVAIVDATAGTSSSAASSAQPPATESTGSLIGTLMRIVLILLVTGGLGAFGVWAFRNILRGKGSIQKVLENAEGKLLNKQPLAEADTPPATLALKRPEQQAAPPTEPAPAPPAEAKAEIVPPPEPPTPAAPQWLAKGLEAAAAQPPAGAPAPAAAPPSDVATTPPAALTPPAPPQPPAEPAPAAASATAQAPLPEPTPAPVPAPAPLPEPSPPPAPPSAPAPAAAPTARSVLEPAAVPEPASAAPDQPPAPTSTALESVSPQTLPEDEVLPQWLQESDVPTNGTTAQPAQEASAPETVSTDTVQTPPVLSPLPTPTPSPQPAAGSPNPEDAARLERERERKRRKRQRYRENLKKRKEETPQDAAASPPVQESTSVPENTPAASQTSPAAEAPPAQNKSEVQSPAEPEDKIAFVVKAEGLQNEQKQKSKNDH